MEYLKEMAGGRGRITQLKDGENLPAINTVEAWDGQDGEVRVQLGAGLGGCSQGC